MSNGLVKDVDRVAEMNEQDEPPVEQNDFTLKQLTDIAEQEADFQSALRGPIIVPEWQNAAIYCRRLDAVRNREVAEVYLKNDRENYAIFAERALDKNGNRLFPAKWKPYEITLQRMNQEVIARIVDEMAKLSKTQLTEKDLGNSSGQDAD